LIRDQSFDPVEAGYETMMMPQLSLQFCLDGSQSEKERVGGEHNTDSSYKWNLLNSTMIHLTDLTET
jgi:hypothetical protein